MLGSRAHVPQFSPFCVLEGAGQRDSSSSLHTRGKENAQVCSPPSAQGYHQGAQKAAPAAPGCSQLNPVLGQEDAPVGKGASYASFQVQVLSLGSTQKPCVVMSIWNLNTPMDRWEVETGELSGSSGPATLQYTVWQKQERPCLSRAGGEHCLPNTVF